MLAIMARNTFRYSPPSPLNLLGFVTLTSLGILFMQTVGEPLLARLRPRFSLFEILVVGGFAWYMLVFWAVGLFYIRLDATQRPAFLARHKIQRRDDGEPSTLKPGRLAHTVRVVLFNQFFGTLPMLVVLYACVQWRGMSLDDPIPSPLRVLGDLAILLACQEVLFYGFHRALHWRPLMKRFHRMHHEFKEPIGICTHYVHWVEHMTGNLIPVFAGIVVSGCHLWVGLTWVAIVVVNAIHTHSDYHFPWMGYAVDHDWHHYHVFGNYGAMGVLDRLLGTDAALREQDAAWRAARDRGAQASSTV